MDQAEVLKMKLYTCTGAPSPERVTAYLRHKGIAIDTVEVDLRAGAHFSDDFRRLNPYCTVPVLQLEDGSCLWMTGAIRMYLEALYPEIPLLGTDARQRAEVAMWQNWVEFNGLYAVMNAYRNAAPGLADRALPGAHKTVQIPALAERERQRYQCFLDDLNQRLDGAEYVAGDDFSVADIDARVSIDFATRAIKIQPATEHTRLQRWYKRLGQQRAFS
jgi:glutathione S-transferase